MAEPTTTSVTMPPEVRDFAKQEVRLAAVLNGGVSLAVWMSGVTLEFHHLAMASAGLGSWPTYAEVLDVLGATARVDVIAGTSAGGLNGAFLALGLTRKLDFTGLRDVWAEAGALESLLRKPLSKNPPSALSGDGYFLAKLRTAFTDMTTKWRKLDPEDKREIAPVDLILTGTLWDGRKTRFADDMGVAITERDYNATFRFTSRPPDNADAPRPAGLLTAVDGPDRVLDQLASAARCTSSFPAAFEPHYVRVAPHDDEQVNPQPPGRWPSSAGQSNFDTSQYVLDGGILLNKPLRPALDAIYSQTAQKQVRRVLGYVVPDPGEPPTEPATDTVQTKTQPPIPVAPDVLLGVLTRLTSTDSVSRELAQIRDTNTAVRSHRRARGRLSLVMAQAAPTMVSQLWDGYREERINDAAATISDLIAQGESARVHDTSAMTERWSVQELNAGLKRIGKGNPGFGFVPSQTDPQQAVALAGGAWTWGQTTLVRLSDMTIDLMKRAVMLAPVNSSQQEAIVEQRGRVRETLHDIARYNRDLAHFWGVDGPVALPPPPRRLFAGAGSGSAANVAELDAWLEHLVKRWDGDFGDDDGASRRNEQYEGACKLAAALVAVRPTIDAVLDPTGAGAAPTGQDAQVLSALSDWLVPKSIMQAPEDERAGLVLAQMLRLDIVLVATSGALSNPEQEVELVQISCDDRDRVTGMQLHHFGAFYRQSWRVNDWIEGRLDGTRQLVRLLLDPARFRQRGYRDDALLTALHGIAVPPGRDQAWLERRWQDNLDAYRREIADALQPDAPATSFDLISDAVARPLQLAALREDLPSMAKAIRAEASDAMSTSTTWLAGYDAALQLSVTRDDRSATTLSAEQLWQLRVDLAQIGTQKITDDVGSDTFARTTSHAAVVTTGAFSSKTAINQFKPLRGVISALRGYVLMVYAMVAYLSRGSRIGQNIVGVAAAVGAALLAVTIFVPAVPVGLTIAGVVLLFAAASAAALRTRDLKGAALRLAIVALLFAAVLGWLIYRDINQHGFHGEVVSTVIKIGIGLGVVVVGFFVANGGWRRRARK